MKLSPNFDRSEFEQHGPMPEECVAAYTALCLEILEPIRAKFGPIVITSGYRSPEANAAAHGVGKSQHEATADFCAADWYARDWQNLQVVYVWILENAAIQWDQMIFEKGLHNFIIHSSWSKTPRRMALVGETANRGVYTARAVTPYAPQSV